MSQPVPKVSEADVERIVRRDFPEPEVPAVLAALAAYGTKAWHNEVPRVRLAILKLAAGRGDALARAVALADVDYRDVLAAAEYPAYFRTISPVEPDTVKRKLAIDADWQEYRAWFEKR